VPKRGGPVSRWFGRTILRLGGWRFEGTVPDVPKFICIGAPHSSNWDYIWVMGGVLALGVRMSIMGKHTLLKGPLAPIMRWSGVIPVDRRAAGGVVGEMARRFREMDQLTMAIAPEGTRTPGAHWKSGFWHIARQANVPVLPCALDYRLKMLRFGDLIWTSDDLAADMARVSAFYDGVQGAKRTLRAPITVKELAGQDRGTPSE